MLDIMLYFAVIAICSALEWPILLLVVSHIILDICSRQNGLEWPQTRYPLLTSSNIKPRQIIGDKTYKFTLTNLILLEYYGLKPTRKLWFKTYKFTLTNLILLEYYGLKPISLLWLIKFLKTYKFTMVNLIYSYNATRILKPTSLLRLTSDLSRTRARIRPNFLIFGASRTTAAIARNTQIFSHTRIYAPNF